MRIVNFQIKVHFKIVHFKIVYFPTMIHSLLLQSIIISVTTKQKKAMLKIFLDVLTITRYQYLLGMPLQVITAEQIKKILEKI